MKCIIRITLLKARVILIVGDYDDIKHEIPYGIDCFNDDNDYMARTTFKKVDNKLPFTAVIHSKSAAISSIAHEAVHACSYISKELGMYPDNDNDEFQAYFVQHICEHAETMLNTYQQGEQR
jgi:hypothetical protein